MEPSKTCLDCGMVYYKKHTCWKGSQLTEGTKHDTSLEKTPWQYFPWDAAEATMMVLQFGAHKYDWRNWEKGMAWGRLFRAAFTHGIKWFFWREDVDPETGLPHLAHMSCCVLFMLSYVLRKVGTDDRPKIPAIARSSLVDALRSLDKAVSK